MSELKKDSPKNSAKKILWISPAAPNISLSMHRKMRKKLEAPKMVSPPVFPRASQRIWWPPWWREEMHGISDRCKVQEREGGIGKSWPERDEEATNVIHSLIAR